MFMRNRLARKMAVEMREATCAGTQTSKAPTLSGPSVTNHYSVARVANLILYYSNVNVLRNDNNVARVKSKRIETNISSIINIKLSKPIFGLPMR